MCTIEEGECHRFIESRGPREQRNTMWMSPPLHHQTATIYVAGESKPYALLETESQAYLGGWDREGLCVCVPNSHGRPSTLSLSLSRLSYSF